MKKITFVFILILSGLTLGFGQTYKMSNGASAINGSATFYDDGGAADNHGSNKNFTQTFSAPAGQFLTVDFSEFDLGANDYLYVYDGANTSARLINYFTGTTNPGTITSEAGNHLTFVFTSDNSTLANGAGWTATLRNDSHGPIAVQTCATASPFCTGTNYNFPNATGQASLGSGGIYGCLGSTPNPIWYYCQVGTSGNIVISINQTSNSGTAIDVDYVCWGPFTSAAAGCSQLSASNIVSCSYSSSASETCTIPNAVTGQFYILLLTNYNGAAGHITFSQTGGSGTTNCAVLCNTTASNTGPVCAGSTVNLTSTSTATSPTFSWTGPNGFTSTAQNPTGVTPPATPGTYTYTVVATPSGGSASTCSATTVVTVKAVPTVTTGTTNVISCTQTTAVLSGSSSPAGATLVWNGPGATNAANPFSATTAGTYTLTGTLSGCSSTASITVTSNTAIPTPSYTTPDGTALTCIVQSVSLNGSANPGTANVAWSGPSGAIAGNPAVVSAPGTYTLTATDPSNGCAANTTVVITSNGATPNISVSSAPNTTVISCRDSAIVLTGSSTTPNIVDGWTGPGGGIVGNPITVTASGQYTYQVTDNSNGCQSSSSINITVDTLQPNIGINTPNTIITCAQTSLPITGTSTTGNVGFAWTQNGNGIAGNPISVTDSGTYVLVVTNNTNGCTSTQSQVITKDVTVPNAGITAPNTTINCAVSSVSLLGTSTTAGATFAWDGPTGPTTSNPISVSQAGTYTLTVTNPNNGCTSTQTVAVTEDIAQPNVSFTTPNGTQIDCNTPTVSLNGASTTNGVTMNWVGSAGNPLGNPATVGSADTYTLTVLNPSNGCSSTASVTVTSSGALPNISYTASAPNITCSVSSVTLTGSSTTPGATMTWTSSAGPLTGNPVTVTSAGSYTLAVTDNSGTGCVSTNVAVVGTDTIHPNANILPSNTTITCASPSSTLTGTSTTPGASFGWAGPSGVLAGNPVSVTTAGTYTLGVLNPANGCSSIRTFTLNSNTTPPTVSIANSGTTVITCSTPTVTLSASANPTSVNYNWSGSGSGSNPIVNATSPGTYNVTVTDPNNGCSGSNSMVITQNTAVPGVNAGASGMLNCDGSPVPLNGSSPVPGATFSWSGPGQFSDTNASTTTTTVGTYTLSATDPSNGCVGTGTVAVLTNTQVPNVNAGLNQNIKCNKPVVALNGSSNTPNATYSWAGPGITTPVTTATCSTSVVGNYTLTVTNPATGCKATDQVLVTSTPAPNAAFTATPTEGYVPLEVNFTNASTGSNLLSWNFGNGTVASSPNPATTYTTSGTYTVMLISSASGQCKDTAYITIEVKEPTSVVIPNIFSPNADGTNDLFKPTTKAVQELTIDIFDRWGKHVITFDGLTGSWNGSGNNDGTYFYIAKGRGTDKSEIEEKGFVLLVR